MFGIYELGINIIQFWGVIGLQEVVGLQALKGGSIRDHDQVRLQAVGHFLRHDLTDHFFGARAIVLGIRLGIFLVEHGAHFGDKGILSGGIDHDITGNLRSTRLRSLLSARRGIISIGSSIITAAARQHAGRQQQGKQDRKQFFHLKTLLYKKSAE